MADQAMAKLFETQISLSEWLKNAQHTDAVALRVEDSDKRARIGIVNEIIGLPYDKPTSFDATDLRDSTPSFLKYLKKHGKDSCCLRLMPKNKNSNSVLLRMRGKTVKDVMGWFFEQDINAEEYYADFVPHPTDYSWSTVFVVNDHGIFGEIYMGSHSVLTQGFHESVAPTTFSFDFSSWQLCPEDNAALEYLENLVKYLCVRDKDKRAMLTKRVQATFADGKYLKGYFETTDAKKEGTWFIDYNRMLGERYGDFVATSATKQNTSADALLRGRTGSPGKAEGRVRILKSPSDGDLFATGDILVCAMTSPDYLPTMQKAAAIITDQGGILCHAAIVARELKVPCIVATQNATSILMDGQHVRVDSDLAQVWGV